LIIPAFYDTTAEERNNTLFEAVVATLARQLAISIRMVREYNINNFSLSSMLK
jgi:hypothetical protein